MKYPPGACSLKDGLAEVEQQEEAGGQRGNPDQRPTQAFNGEDAEEGHGDEDAERVACSTQVPALASPKVVGIVFTVQPWTESDERGLTIGTPRLHQGCLTLESPPQRRKQRKTNDADVAVEQEG